MLTQHLPPNYETPSYVTFNEMLDIFCPLYDLGMQKNLTLFV